MHLLHLYSSGNHTSSSALLGLLLTDSPDCQSLCLKNGSLALRMRFFDSFHVASFALPPRNPRHLRWGVAPLLREHPIPQRAAQAAGAHRHPPGHRTEGQGLRGKTSDVAWTYDSGSTPMVPFWGRCTTHFRTYCSGDWDVHWGYDLGFDPWPY